MVRGGGRSGLQSGALESLSNEAVDALMALVNRSDRAKTPVRLRLGLHSNNKCGYPGDKNSRQAPNQFGTLNAQRDRES